MVDNKTGFYWSYMHNAAKFWSSKLIHHGVWCFGIVLLIIQVKSFFVFFSRNLVVWFFFFTLLPYRRFVTFFTAMISLGRINLISEHSVKMLYIPKFSFLCTDAVALLASYFLLNTLTNLEKIHPLSRESPLKVLHW